MVALSERQERYEATRESEDRHAFAGLPAGKVCILAHTPWNAVGEERFLGSAVVEIGTEGEREVELVLDAAEGIVEGTILDTEGKPVPGVRLRAGSELPYGQRTYGVDSTAETTDERGWYQFTHLYPGLCELHVERNEAVAGLGFLPARQMLEIGPGELRTGVDIRAAPSMRVEGRIESRLLEASMDPPTLLLRGSNGSTGSTPIREGHFAFQGVFPGTYELTLIRGETELARIAVGPESRTDLVLPAK